jgi:hypothetical protein
MNAKRNPLQLADSLEADFKSDTYDFDDMIEAAIELRRLHNEILVYHNDRLKLSNEVDQLKAAFRKQLADEREACAAICDSVNSYDNPMTANDVADAIRARGKT